MPSQNMLPKGKRRQSVMKEYREQRTVTQERVAAQREAGVVEEDIAPPLTYDTAEMYTTPSPFAGRPGLVTDGPDGGKHPSEEKTQPRYGAPRPVEPDAPDIHVLDDLEAEDGVRSLTAEAAAAGMRVDAYLARALPDVSRARVQLLTENGQVSVDGKVAKSKQKLKGGELIEIEGEPKVEPLNATAENIPLTLVYEDDDLAVINKPAGMMVHAGSGAPEHNQGTLVNALLFYFGREGQDVISNSLSSIGLSSIAGALRPGIVHRLDKQTSGLIIVAKNDIAHRKLGEMFAERRMRKSYIALVHGEVKSETGTIQLPISRDLLRRIRMTTRRAGGRSAVSHWKVLQRLDGPYGKFTLVQVAIETGRTHQIRVHMAAIGHPVVGDFLYGAPHRIGRPGVSRADDEGLTLERNFLHAAELAFDHPISGAHLELQTDLPPELTDFLERLKTS